MSRIQLSRARRQVRRVKTASHHREEASTGHKGGEGEAQPADSDAHRGRARLRSPHRVISVSKRNGGGEFDQNEQVVAGN